MSIQLAAHELRDERELSETRDGWKGRRLYYVSTGTVDVAVFGNGSGSPQGLPKKGDPWDTIKAPNLVVVSRKFVREAGVNTDLLNQTGGYTHVRVEYETPGFGGGDPPAAAGIAFTRLAPTSTQLQAIYGIDPASGEVPAGAKQLADGQGASRDIGLLSYEVLRPLSPTAFNGIDMPRLVLLHQSQATNSDPATLPAYLSSTRSEAFAPGQLRFTGFSLDDPDESGYRYLRYSLAAAIDHRFRWTAQGQDGDASATEFTADIYRTLSFAGLW